MEHPGGSYSLWTDEKTKCIESVNTNGVTLHKMADPAKATNPSPRLSIITATTKEGPTLPV